MFAALQDSVPVLRSVSHVDPSIYIQIYNKEIYSFLEENLLQPLCEAIEVDLRLHIHYHLEIAERDPFRKGVKDLAALVSAKPFYFIDRSIDIKGTTTRRKILLISVYGKTSNKIFIIFPLKESLFK